MNSGEINHAETGLPNGLTLKIYQELKIILDEAKAQLLKSVENTPADTQETRNKIEEAIDQAEEDAKKLSHCIAVGIVQHLSNGAPNDSDTTESISTNMEDPIFWNWLLGFANAFKNWDANTGVQGLQQALSSYTNNVPQSLKGVLR